MSHLWTSVRIDAFNRQSHDAPRDYHLSRGQSTSVKDQCTRHLLTQAASERLCGKLGKKGILIA